MITKCRHLLFFLLVSSCESVFADIGIDVLCLSSTDAKPINMEMRFYVDKEAKWTAGFVKYQNSKKPISIVQKSSVQEVTSPTMSYEHTDLWLEVANGKVSGSYEITIQGTQLPSATYENYANKRKYFFLLNSDVDGTPADGCLWK